MRSTSVLPLLFLTLPTFAQELAPSPVQAVGGQAAYMRNSGLRPAASGRGLLGGGADYRVHFTSEGMRFEPALGTGVATTQHFALAPASVRRGDALVAQLPSLAPPVSADRAVRYEHAGGVTERYDVQPEGVELSWVFDQPMAGEGDLVVRYAVDTSLPAPTAADGGLLFMSPEFGGVKLGGVTGIDARGTKVAGRMQYVGRALELSLPAAFVAGATYPIVLDPLIGTVFGVSSGLTYADAQPDAAYDATTNRFLVTWLRTLAANTVEVRGQLVNNGTLVGGTIFFGSFGVAARPRVANLGTRFRFGVVWTQVAGSTSSVEFEAVAAGNGALSHAATLASSTAGTYTNVDVGCETGAAVGVSRGFVLVYEDNVLNAIRAQRLWFTVADLGSLGAPFSVFTNGVLGPSYISPAISRTAAADGRFLVVARRSNLVGAPAIVGTVVSSNTSVLGPTTTIYSNSNNDVSVPDVDGYASKWVVAWQQQGTASSSPAVAAAPVSLGGAALVVGTSQSVGGSQFFTASAPSVGYTPGKTWLGYHYFSGLPSPGTNTLRARGIDSDTCVFGADTFSVIDYGGQNRIVVATKTSGGLTSGEDALAVYDDTFDDVYAQRLQNHSNGGTLTNLGGGCGAGGTQSYSHNPAIGSSGLVCSVNGLPATALATIFNFAAPGAPVPCGACVWTPFSVTLSPPIVGTSASVEFPIPYIAALANSVFETQWTTIDFAQAPCAVFPGLALTHRVQMTIGL